MRFDDVQEFLRGQGSSGQRDSTGEFTISSERAFEKLALHSLDHPEEWILKAVQAAVRGGSSRLMFRCTRRALVVDFFDLEEECLEDWRVALLKPGWCESAFFKEFEIGLRSVLLRHRFRTTSRDGRVLDWDGRELRVHQGSPLRESSCLQLEVAHDQLGGDSKRLWPVSRARKALAYQSLLQSRALYAPLELVFDGRPITALEATLNDTEGPRLWGRPTSSALLYCELGKNFDGHTLARCLELTASKLLSDALHARNHFLFTPSPSKEIFYHFHLFAKYTTEPGGEHEEAYRAMKRAQFRFEFTRLGVVCATRAGSRVLGGAFHIPYDEGRSDVSGLSLFIPKERTSEMDALLCRTAPLLVRLEKELERHESRAHWEAGALRRGAVGLASGGPVVGVGGLLAGAKVALALKLGALGGALAGVPILLSCQKDTKDQIADIREAVKMFRDFSGKVGH